MLFKRSGDNFFANCVKNQRAEVTTDRGSQCRAVETSLTVSDWPKFDFLSIQSLWIESKNYSYCPAKTLLSHLSGFFHDKSLNRDKTRAFLRRLTNVGVWNGIRCSSWNLIQILIFTSELSFQYHNISWQRERVHLLWPIIDNDDIQTKLNI